MPLRDFQYSMQHLDELEIFTGVPPANDAWIEEPPYVIPSDEAHIFPFLDELDARVTANCGADDAFRISLCLREAILNYALKNNKGDAAKNTSVCLYHTGARTCFEISGEGDSFDLRKICRTGEECAHAGNLLLTTGRGNMLMRANCDFMAYTIEDREHHFGGKRLYLGFDLK